MVDLQQELFIHEQINDKIIGKMQNHSHNASLRTSKTKVIDFHHVHLQVYLVTVTNSTVEPCLKAKDQLSFNTPFPPVPTDASLCYWRKNIPYSRFHLLMYMFQLFHISIFVSSICLVLQLHFKPLLTSMILAF